MTGAKVFLVFGEVTQPGEDFYGIHTFQIMASNLDRKLTKGLCGLYNDNPSDDMIPQGETTNIETQRNLQSLGGDDNAPVMFPMDVKAGRSIPVDLNWKNGWTEQKARQQCIDAFQSSSSFSVCDTHVPSVPSEDYIKKCIADIRLTGDTGWKDITISNFGSACLQEASRLENLTETNETDSSGVEISIFDAIQISTCQRTAQEEDFVLKIQYNETSDTGISEIEAGIYNSPFAMQCPAPISRRKRSLNVDSSAFGYFISVSNDGNNFTKELAVIIYDSMCFECSTTNLTCLELDTCPQLTPVATDDNKSKTGAYIGAGVSGGLVVITVLVVFTIIKKKILKSRSSVKDSTVSLSENVSLQAELHSNNNPINHKDVRSVPTNY
ncbi:unnamed protein product [Mytilus edulis]|uniref:VWFD domain-containing protein n=1 Tax=Mytilus edulis TaxID=6550 RepID=A0A8S3QT99_MYTED|nr:unnamed protein product [Mytilus edulis]